MTNESNILNLLIEFSEKLPKFEDGRIDYTNSEEAPVITVFVKYKEEILLLKRSDKVGTYKEKWNTIAGYLDEIKPIKEKVLEELREEIDVHREQIKSIKFREPYPLIDKELNKKWLIHPVLVELKEKPEIKLDWEHTEYKWIYPKELSNYDTIIDFARTLKLALEDEQNTL